MNDLNHIIKQAINSLERVSNELIKTVPEPLRKLGDDPKDYPRQFSHSYWECDDSPTGYCMYTNYIGYDCCIFCGDPEERK